MRKRWAQAEGGVIETGSNPLVRFGAQERYRTYFRGLGSQLRTLPASWSELTFVYVSDGYAEAAMQQGTGDSGAISIVSFIRLESDGRWVISAF